MKPEPGQYDLFGGTAPFERCSETSRAAAESMYHHATGLGLTVLATIMLYREMTCDEVELITGLRHQTASARVRELVLKGFIRPTGEKRKTRSGRMAVVYGVAK